MLIDDDSAAIGDLLVEPLFLVERKINAAVAAVAGFACKNLFSDRSIEQDKIKKS